MADRIGVDVGGTFTDLIHYDEASGLTSFAKVPSTPRMPESGVLDAIAAGLSPSAAAAARYLVHGNTVGLNTLLEGTGARVGLLATEGFRDVVETRRGDRSDPYDLFWTPPAPLVPRRLRVPIGGRILADGSVLLPLDAEAVCAAVPLFVEEGVECVAIAFMNAYANPAHEREAASLLRDAGFTGEISLSHEVSGEYREYERTCTTLVDAYLRPRVASYLGRLEGGLRQAGVVADVMISRSGGGAMSVSEARSRPFESIMSGPVGGAQGAAELARRLGIGDLVTADVGGTSFDTCVIVDGEPQVLYEGQVVGLPLQTPWIDVRSIGAGGGSIAHVDAGGLLRVGPGSAGADPGPACYGRGGTHATVTDAAFTLGMLGDGHLASGLRLDREAAAAVCTALAEDLGLTLDDTARGILTISAAAMANAIREITIEQGRDPRDLGLVAFGGAGPLFATLLAQELGIRRVVVPPFAGNFSAWGLLGADLTRSAGRTRIVALDDAGLAAAGETMRELHTTVGDERSTRQGQLDVRYAGQEHTLTVDVTLADDGALDDDAETIGSAFTAAYRTTYGHSMDEHLEIVSVRATARTALPRRSLDDSVPTTSRDHEPREAWSFHTGAWERFEMLDRASLRPGSWHAGPALVLEDTTTTYVDAGFAIVPHETGALLLETEGASDAR